MQHATLTRRLLAVLLSLAMLLSFMVPAVSAENPEKTTEEAEQTKTLELTPIDPATLHVQKLGEVENEAPATEEMEPYALTDIVRVSATCSPVGYSLRYRR